MVNIDYTSKPHSTTKLHRRFTDAELAAAEPCTCRPLQDAYLCISCRERNRRLYGDDIYFGSPAYFDVKDQLAEGQEVIDD